MNKNIKRVGLGCGSIIGAIFLLVLIMRLPGMFSGDDNKEANEIVKNEVNENDLIKRSHFNINKKIFDDEHYISFICELDNNVKDSTSIALRTYLQVNSITSGREDMVLVSLFNRKNKGMINITNKDLLSEEYFEGFKYNKIPEDILVDHMVFDKYSLYPGSYFDNEDPRRANLISTFVLALDKNEEPISPNYNLNISVDSGREEKTSSGWFKGADRNWYTWWGSGSSSNKNINESTSVQYHLSREGDELQGWHTQGVNLVGATIWKPCTKVESEGALDIFIKVFDKWTENRKIAFDAAKEKSEDLENKKQF